MTKPTIDPREQQQRDAQQAREQANENQQRAESNEVVGRQLNDGLKENQGGGTPRGK